MAVPPSAPASVVAASAISEVPTQTAAAQVQQLIRAPSAKLPKAHWFAYRGDVKGLLQCITENGSLHETVTLRNQHGRLVCGITPLFLAAQRGHFDLARLLVENGANPMQPCFIQGTTELCTPAEVASLNLHFRLSRYLKKAAQKRREEDAVLALDDADGMSIASHASRARSLIQSARSVLTRRSSRPLGTTSVPTVPVGVGAGGADVAEGGAAADFMAHVDLANFDPDDVSSQPRTSNKSKISSVISKLFSRRSAVEVSQSQRMAGNLATTSRGSDAARTANAGARAMRHMDLEAHDLQEGGNDASDHTKVLDRFLKDLDLANWQPEADGPLAMGGTASLTQTRASSPARSTRSSRGGGGRNRA